MYATNAREGENAILVERSATGFRGYDGEPVCFDFAIPVRRFKIGHPETWGVMILYQRPRKHKWDSHQAFSGNSTYFTIETTIGYVLYDSRGDVPCDMEVFAAAKKRSVQEWIEKGYKVAGVES
jgi:hypothetical protein